MKTKSIKDAVHGYVRLEEPYWKVIDTIEFQRLKWIEQTSYRVLYPSARHDRFIHSIGTYHLGQKAFDGFSKNIAHLLKNRDLPLKHRNAFLLACLLHDVGHAPFSHTCEDLYNYHSQISAIDGHINKELITIACEKLSTEEFNIFKQDYEYIIRSTDGICKAPSEHEIMSAIITMVCFDTFTQGFIDVGLERPDLDLVIRSILGCVYAVNRGALESEIEEKGIKNCFIRLLNSATVDVDKLDYIARDTLMSGYENVILDSDRLLNSLSFVIKDKVYYPAFNKSALSVINNVIVAKNAQAKWIINHPIVIYENYLLRKSIGVSLKSIYNIKCPGDSTASGFDGFLSGVFSSQSLSKNINDVNGLSFSLLSDIDIVFHMKECIYNKDVEEFFNRKERKSPVWKSHEEFLYCLGNSNKAREVADFFAPLITYLEDVEDLYHTKKVDQELYNNLTEDTEIYQKEELLEILGILKNYCVENPEVIFEFVLLPANNKFSTKINGDQTYIRFGDGSDEYTTYSTFQNDNIPNRSTEYEFFYLYSKTKLNSKILLEYLYKKVHALIPVRV